MNTHALLAWNQIQAARQYTLELLQDFDEHQWFVTPSGLATHLAWQVGHLAMAEYGLALFRQRGRAPEDRDLMPGYFRKRFSRGSQPDLNRLEQETPEFLRSVLDRVHAQVESEISSFSDIDLEEPVDMPYAAYPNRFGSLLFCAHHEMLHAGQIGLLRRLLGKSPRS